MKHPSIFEGVVRGEDSHTDLLRNLMCADTAYGIEVCKMLQPKGLSLELDKLPEVQTQVMLKAPPLKHGRADLVIESKSAVLLVEVKTDLYCPLTKNQDFGLDDAGRPKVKGYVAYLEHRKQQGFSVGLCLLAPRCWTRRPKIEHRLHRLEVPAHLVTWESLRMLTTRAHFGKMAQEFGSFLERDFMSISFGEEEASLLTSGLGLEVFASTSLKLHELVKQATKQLKADLNSGNTRFEVKEPSGDASEHGVFVYRGDKCLIWFGIWDEARWPLVVGVDEKWGDKRQELDLSGLSSVRTPISAWKTFQLPQECFTGPEPLPILVSALKRIVRIQPA